MSESEAALQALREEAQRELTSVREEWARAERKLAAGLEESEQRRLSEGDELREKIASLTEELAEERREREGRERLQASLIGQEAQKAAELGEARAELAELGVRLAAVEREKSLLEGELRQAGRRIEAFEERVAALMEKQMALTEEAEAHARSIRKLEKELEASGGSA